MVLARDLSHLPAPAAQPRAEANSPDPEPRFVTALVDAWAATERANGPKARAHADTRWRHSDAGKCARAVAYAALDVPDSDPMDLSGYWNTGLGTVIHEAWQEAILRRYPGAVVVEPKVRTGDTGSGHIDAVVTLPDGRTVAIELKSVGGFAYKMAVGERGAAQGPKHEHVIQGALNAVAVGADEMVIAYLSKEAISVNAAQRKGFSETARFCAEWTYSPDDFIPLAAAETARMEGILALLDEGKLPLRRFPDPELPRGHEIVDPIAGRWEVTDDAGQILDTNTWWACGYCRWQTLCAATPAGRPSVSVIPEIGRRDGAA